jgi:hypothetical protein
MSLSLVQIIRQWARSNVFGILKDQGQGERVFRNVGNSPPPSPPRHKLEYSNLQRLRCENLKIQQLVIRCYIYSEMSALHKHVGGAHPMSATRVCCYMCTNHAHTFVRRFPTLYISLKNNDTGKESVNLKIYILWKKIQNVILLSLVPLPFWVPVSYPPQNVGNSCHTRV